MRGELLILTAAPPPASKASSGRLQPCLQARAPCPPVPVRLARASVSGQRVVRGLADRRKEVSPSSTGGSCAIFDDYRVGLRRTPRKIASTSGTDANRIGLSRRTMSHKRGVGGATTTKEETCTGRGTQDPSSQQPIRHHSSITPSTSPFAPPRRSCLLQNPAGAVDSSLFPPRTPLVSPQRFCLLPEPPPRLKKLSMTASLAASPLRWRRQRRGADTSGVLGGHRGVRVTRTLAYRA